MGRTPDAAKRMMSELLLLEPGTQNGGMYTYKPGYHASRADNIAMDKVDTTDIADYSIRDAPDKLGPSDCSAGFDWTHPKAQAGSYASMDKYGERLESAFNAKDPRLNGWREALGQTDLDSTAEGLDFRYWTRRTPDSSHEWHWHFSEVRAYVESWSNKLAFLSILKGETLQQYLANGGKLFKRDGTGEMVMAEVWGQDDENVAWATTCRAEAILANADAADFQIEGETTRRHEPNLLKAQLNRIEAQAKANGEMLSQIFAAVQKLTTPPAVEAAVDYAKVQAASKAGTKEALREGTA